MPTPSSQPKAVYEQVPRRAGLANTVKVQLLAMISAGQLAPGDRLPPERELAMELGVSRNVVREALRSLMDSNILQARQGAGVFVTALDVESLMEPLEFVFSLERAALQSLVAARLVIEPGIAALAATHATDEDLRAVDALVEHSGRDDPSQLLEHDIELHGRIVRMAGNPFLTRIMESLGHLTRSSRDFTNSVPRMRRAAQADHERIVAALCARDPEAARAAMHEHLEHVAATLAGST